MNQSDKRSRFFDHDHDPSKSLPHVLAQRSTRSSPARHATWTSQSLMHLDVGDIDLTSHVHVPAVSVQSHVPSAVLSNCKGHAAAVSSQRPSVSGENDCASSSMSHNPDAPVMSCSHLRGLLDRSFWMDHRSGGRQPVQVRKPVTHELPRRSMKYAQMTRVLAPPSRRQAAIEGDSLSEICAPMPDVKIAVLSEECGGVVESRGAGTRSFAASTCAEVRTGCVSATTPPFTHACRPVDVSRWKFGRIDEAKRYEHPHHGGVVEPYLAVSSSV